MFFFRKEIKIEKWERVSPTLTYLYGNEISMFYINHPLPPKDKLYTTDNNNNI